MNLINSGKNNAHVLTVDPADKRKGVPEILKARDLVKIFWQRQSLFSAPRPLSAVAGVSLSLMAGESLGLVGESGCGKSTLGRLLCGLLNPDGGDVLFQGRSLPLAGARSWARGRIQMVFQDPASSLNPKLSVISSIEEPLRAQGRPRNECRIRAEEMLATVGLAGQGAKYPHEFSGGQRQRLAVGRALMTEPEILICDEAVAALDASVQAQILNLLREVQERFAPACLFISHDLSAVGFLCSRIAVMYLGELVEMAPANIFFGNAAHPYSQALLGAMPEGGQAWRHGKDLGNLPAAMIGELPSPFSPPTGCRYHPRCALAMPVCSRLAPAWHEVGPDWRARCHLLDQPEIK